MFGNRTVKFIFIFELAAVLLCLIFAGNPLMNDTLEHLRDSWLVSQGAVPYRDFFEHHHPLLWYVYLPFTVLIPHNFDITFYFARVFSLMLYSLVFWVLCKIVGRYAGGKEAVPYFLIMLLAFAPVWWTLISFKPETVARPLYFLGLYLFFRYAEKGRRKYLVRCGIAFAFSFLAIQNILVNIAPLFFPFLYLWDKKYPHAGRDFLCACIAPLIIISAFAALIVFSSTWKDYFELNWLFNSELFGIMHYQDKSILWQWTLPILAGFAAWIYLGRKGEASFYINTIGLLLCCELLERICIKAVFVHYMVMLFVFISLLCAPVFAKIRKGFALDLCYIILISGVCAGLGYLRFTNNLELMKILNTINLEPEKNSVANIDFETMNIWHSQDRYYTISLSTAMTDDYLFRRHADFNINRYIEDNKIKYLDYTPEAYTPIMFDCDAECERNFGRFLLKPEVLDKYIMKGSSFWQRIETLGDGAK